MITKQFSRVVCINLDRRPDRWKAFQESAGRVFAPGVVQRFPAIDIQDIAVPGWWPNRKAGWACTNSHLAVVEAALRDGCETLMVFEDDAVFADDFESTTLGLLKHVPQDWFGLWLGGREARKVRVGRGICRLNRAIATHGYVLHQRGLRQVYDHLALRKRDIDRAYCELHRKHPFYAPEYFVVGQSEGKSDLGSRPFKRDMYWNDSQRIEDPPTDVACLRTEILQSLHDAVTPTGVRFWAVSNFLREIVGLDDDPTVASAAFGVSQADRPAMENEVIRALRQAGFGTPVRWLNNAGETTEFSFRRGGAKFTFFAMHREAGTVRWHFYGRGLQRVRACAEHRLESRPAFGRDWLVPSPPERFLAEVYGDAKEAKEVHYMSNMRGVVSSVPWTGRKA